MSVETLLRVVILIAWPGAVAIPVMYLFAPWYRSHLGRALMASSVGLALLVTLSALRVVATFGEWPDAEPFTARRAVRLFVYSLITFGIYYELAVMGVLRWRGTDIHADHHRD